MICLWSEPTRKAVFLMPVPTGKFFFPDHRSRRIWQPAALSVFSATWTTDGLPLPPEDPGRFWGSWQRCRCGTLLRELPIWSGGSARIFWCPTESRSRSLRSGSTMWYMWISTVKGGFSGPPDSTAISAIIFRRIPILRPETGWISCRWPKPIWASEWW